MNKLFVEYFPAGFLQMAILPSSGAHDVRVRNLPLQASPRIAISFIAPVKYKEVKLFGQEGVQTESGGSDDVDQHASFFFGTALDMGRVPCS